MTTPACRVSLSTGSLYHWPLAAVFRLGRELGLDGLELVIGPEALLRGSSAVTKLQETHGLRVLSLHPPILPVPGWIRFTAFAGKLAQWARELSTPLVTIHTPDIAHLDGERGTRYVNAATRLAGDLAKSGSCLALENRARFRGDEGPMCLDEPGRLGEFAGSLGSAITFDTAHAGTLFPDIIGALDILAPRVANVHLSDLNGHGGGPLARWTDTILRHHQVPGRGTLPLDSILAHLRARDYAGLVTLEISPVALRAWDSSETRSRLASGIAYVRKCIG